MDPTKIRRLKEEYQKGLQACQDKISRWSKFKADYDALKERLNDLPNKLSYDITIPFGSNAFVEGKIVHTNEVMALLGDGWFAEVSAKQATSIAERRTLHCNKMLGDLEKEKEQFQSWLNYINEVSTSEDLVEIVEKFDEAEEEKWRAKHAENVRAYRQKLRERRTDSCVSSSSLEEEVEDMMASQLHDLELTEEESETKSAADSEGSTFEYSDEGSMLSESPGNTFHFFPHDEHQLMCSEEATDHDPSCPDDHESGCEKHVRWQDESKKSIQKITFRHSRHKKNHVIIPNPADTQESPVIQSPSDIYKQFGSFFPPSPPKSILKVKQSPPVSCPLTDAHRQLAFTGEVYEHIESPPPSLEKKSSRPVSQFKNSRKNKRK